MSETLPKATRQLPPIPRVALLLLAAVWAVLAISTVPGIRSQPGFISLWDGWFQLGGYALTAAVAAMRAATVDSQRLLWSLVAAALALRAFAFVYTIVVLSRPPPYPSLADACWVLSGVLLVVALWLIARVHLPRRSRTLVLDALVGGLTAAAVALAVFYPTLSALTGAGIPRDVVAINIAYPLIDVAQLVIVVGMLAATQWRLGPSAGCISIGIVVMAVVDGVFLYLAVVGQFRPGTVITPLSLGGTALVALAGWLPDSGRRGPLPEGPAGLVSPAALALVCVGVLTYDTPQRVPVAATLFAAAGIVAAIGRGYVTLSGDREVATATISAKQLETERFRALVSASNDFIAIAGVDGGVVYVNPAGREMVGLPPGADVTTTTIVDYLTEEGVRASLEVEQPAVVSRGHWEGESTLRDMRGGSPIPVAINSFLMHHPVTGEPWLLATVQRDITERIANERELQQLADQRQLLLGHLVEAQEDERARIAADVHDDSVQALAAVELRLSLLRRQLERHQPELLPTVETLRDTVRGAMDRLRHLLFDLESPAQRTDLATALNEAAAYLFENSLRWRVEGEGGRDLPQGTRVTGYRIAKEALTNVRKHAGAQRVVVGLHDRDGGVEISVADDGAGYDAGQNLDRPGHLGLQGMRDRAAVAGGMVDITSGAGDGTTVRIWLPESGPTTGVGVDPASHS